MDAADFTPAAVSAVLLIPLVGAVREAFGLPGRFVPLFLLALGPALLAVGHVFGFLPDGSTWQDAVKLGWLGAGVAQVAYVNAESAQRAAKKAGK